MIPQNVSYFETLHMWLPKPKSSSRKLNLRRPLWFWWLETFHLHCLGTGISASGLPALDLTVKILINIMQGRKLLTSCDINSYCCNCMMFISSHSITFTFQCALCTVIYRSYPLLILTEISKMI